MSFDLIFGVIFLLLTALILALRTRCNFLVLALCSGYVLSSTLSSTINDLVGANNMSVGGISVADFVKLFMTLLPAILVAGRFYKSQRGVSLLQQLAPALGSVGLVAVFVQPYLEESVLSSSLDNSALWAVFQTHRTAVILYAIVVSMLGILLDGGGGKKRGRPRKSE